MGQTTAPSEENPAVGNLAIVASASTSYVSPDQTITSINSGYEPRNSRDASHRAYGNWPKLGTQWVEYDWTQPISTNKIDVYWFADGQGIRCRGNAS